LVDKFYAQKKRVIAFLQIHHGFVCVYLSTESNLGARVFSTEKVAMPENSKPVRIAVNVMRARLTVIGFNIAIVSFQLVHLYGLSGGIKVPGIDHAVHLTADTALLMALALSLCALVAFMMSGALDEVGVCTHWSLVAGDLLMYLGLAHTVAGFFGPLGVAFDTFAANISARTSEVAILHSALSVAGGAAWFLATYAGPVVSLLRSPFDRRTNIALGVAYLVLLTTLSWINSQAVNVEAAGAEGEPGLVFGVLRELVQPLRW
jgi:hypothetical protein